MLRKLANFALAWLVLASSIGCSSTVAEKSTGTNWLACDSDADCVVVSGATCSRDKWCVDASGDRVRKPASASGSGGASSHDAGLSTGGSTSRLPDGGEATGGRGTIVVVDCFSPGQNLDHVYEPGAVGCECPADAPGFCVQGVALLCENGRWRAVEDGPCFPGCWMPDDPETAAVFPDRGCTCFVDGETRCLHTIVDGYMLATCTEERWTLEKDVTPCGCTSDRQCGFGSRCADGACLRGICEVDGMRYAQGVEGIPDPFSCNTCRCEPQGLGCTTRACLERLECPEGTVGATVCAECAGPLDNCTLTRTGCLPRCEHSDDCADTFMRTCNLNVNACSASCF